MNVTRKDFAVQGDKIEIVIPEECDGFIGVQADVGAGAVLTLFLSLIDDIWSPCAMRSIAETDPTAAGVATIDADGYYIARVNGARRVKLELTTAGAGANAAFGIRYF